MYDRDETGRNRSAESGSGDQVVVGTRQCEVGFTRSGPKDALRPGAEGPDELDIEAVVGEETGSGCPVQGQVEAWLSGG